MLEAVRKEPSDYPENMSDLEIIEFVMAIENELKIDLKDDDIEVCESFSSLLLLIEIEISGKEKAA